MVLGVWVDEEIWCKPWGNHRGFYGIIIDILDIDFGKIHGKF
jgi:hypothetical protein